MEGLLEGLRREAQEIRGHTVAESSRNTYQDSFRVYETVMRNELQMDPFPVDIEKMEVFLVLMKRKRRCYNTLAGYVRAFSYYFRTNAKDCLTQDLQFKIFFSGLRREMTEGGQSCPNAKEPFQLEWFERIVNVYPMEDLGNRRIMFWMTLCFHGFLRISELLGLRKRDITINEADGRMDLFIRRSKTDQMGIGETTYLFACEGPGSPWTYRDVLECCNDDDLIVGGLSEKTLRQWLARILQKVGVEHVERYSFHSFRRGGAHLASLNGASDSVIKAHGRWRSEAYLRYVAVDRRWAGREIAGALSGRRDAPQVNLQNFYITCHSPIFREIALGQIASEKVAGQFFIQPGQLGCLDQSDKMLYYVTSYISLNHIPQLDEKAFRQSSYISSCIPGCIRRKSFRPL